MSIQDTSVIQRIEHLSDTALRLESFSGSDKEQNPVFRDFSGELNSGIEYIYFVI